MINTKVYIDSPSSNGNGNYSAILYFQDSSMAKYLNAEDVLIDTDQNEYKILNFTTPFSDGGSVDVLYLKNNILPKQDSDYLSSVNTPNVFNPKPFLGTSIYINEISIEDAPAYKYKIKIIPDTPTDAAKINTGHSIVDSSGKEFQIISIPSSGLFDGIEFFIIQEIEKIGAYPTEGTATLYSSTDNNHFFQGTALNNGASNLIRNRDFKKLDETLARLKPELLQISIDGNGTHLEFPYYSKNSGIEKTRKLKVDCLVEGVKSNQEVSCIFENTVHISKSGQIVLEQNDFTSKSPGSESILLEATSNQNKTTTFNLKGITGCVGVVSFSFEEFLGA